MTTKFFSILTVMVLLIGLSSCNKKEGLIGEWTLIDIDYSEHLKNIQPELKNSFEDMMDRQAAIILRKTFFEFKEEEAFTITSPKYDGKPTSSDGRWAMNDAKDSLVIENGDFETYAVTFKHQDTILLHSGEQPFRVLTLIKE